MSVTTTADEKVRKARELLDDAARILKEARDNISAALDKDTWGSSDYTSTFTAKMERAETVLTTMIHELRKQLK